MAAIYPKSFFTMKPSSVVVQKHTKLHYFTSQSFRYIIKTSWSFTFIKKNYGSVRKKLILGYSKEYVESDQLQRDVRNKAMHAIDCLGRRVTIGDVASKAGLQLSESQKALQALATDTNGFLEVSDEGDVLYVFPEDYRSNLVAKSFWINLEPLLEKAKAAEYLVRVSFGTTLIASIVIVYTTIIIIALSKSDDDISFPHIVVDNLVRGVRSSDSGFLWYWDPNYYRRQRVHEDGGRMNFIESVFSFVFGDGDPNQGIEEERWKLIGQYILSNGGVVIAEELAPFLDVETPNKTVDESYILPVLLQFDGQPEVDEIAMGIPTCSKTSMSQGALVICLGGVNLLGVIILGTMFNPSSFISFLSKIFPLLQIFAGSFFTIPMIRWFLVRKRNSEIEKRNRAREKYAQALESPNLSLRRKISSARDMAQRIFIGQDRIVYSTKMDLHEQDYDAQLWEEIL